MFAVQQTDPLSQKINTLCDDYLRYSRLRHEALFREFLPKGYKQTTLSSVSPDYYEINILAKMHLGMIITLIDDLADHPGHRNPLLLKTIYHFLEDSDSQNSFNNQQQIADLHSSPPLSLAKILFQSFFSLIRQLPGGRNLQPILNFDLRQVFLANRYAELLSDFPAISNLPEAKAHGPYNMGMVAAGMIDLMASPSFLPSELGLCREIFLAGQRVGRISNVITTYQREQIEGDQTNEIAIFLKKNIPQMSFLEYRKKLHRELNHKLLFIESCPSPSSFNTKAYAKGLRNFFHLHLELEGKI